MKTTEELERIVRELNDTSPECLAAIDELECRRLQAPCALTKAELTKETEALADEIGRGMAMLLWDKYRISLPPAAEKDLGVLAVANCLLLHGLVEKARSVSG